jgi:Mrp family chromosome partitioning ATPase
MSALDQAFIKAYAKDPEMSAAAVAVASPPSRATVRQAARASAQQVEQLYHDGSLYRVEAPRLGSVSAVVPQPHIPLLPPTSPRRSVRRSILRFLASQTAASPLELLPESQPRVARKVIIRHISHSVPSAPRGRLRATLTQSFDTGPIAPAHAPVQPQPAAELPPETITEEPPSGAPAPIVPQPATVSPLAAPNTGPLNVTLDGALDDTPQFAVHGDWKQGAASPATLVGAETAHLPANSAMPLVTVSLDSLSAAEEALRHNLAAERQVTADEPAMTRFAGKSLDDHEAQQPVFRVDAEHSKAIYRPHSRFRTKGEAKQADTTAIAPPSSPAAAAKPPNSEHPVADMTYIEAEAVEEAAASAPTSLAATPVPQAQTVHPDLTFADPASETLPGDLTLLETGPAAASSPRGEQKNAGTATKQAAPLWEMDRFQWPKTCQKLLNDENGYLRQAGNKLLAAVQDGLKVLAVTGSRRGEGRSTLALCLARVAAEAGIQVALMDADFARPQLAGKIGLEIAFGWQDAALGKIPLSEAAVKSLADHITVMPLEPSAAGRALSLADPRVTATIRAASATFELLILDLGPIGPGEELAFPPGERCPLDAAIVVRDLRFATAAESKAIGHRLQDAGIEAVGIAENFVVEEEAS